MRLYVYMMNGRTDKWMGKMSSSTLCPKKRPIFLLSISSPNVNGFSKLFHWHILRTISNKVIIEYCTTHELCRYTTL